MKVGDVQPVTIAGQVVAQARVSEIGEGTVTFIVPGTKVVMATRVELAEAPREEPAVETIITGVDRPNDAVVEAPVPASVEPGSNEPTAVQPAEADQSGQAVAEVVPAETQPAPVKTEAFDSSLVDA
jgi:hypothetical protein